MSDELDFVEQLKELERSKQQLLHGQVVAGRFLDNSNKRLEDINEQIEILRQFMGLDDVPNTLKQIDPIDENDGQTLEMHPKAGDTVRRGAISAKEKQEHAEETEKERQEARESAQQGEPINPSQPQRPNQQGKGGLTPEQQRQLTPDERKDEIRKKLTQRDPRKMKEGLEELKKPENKGLFDGDQEFAKLLKGAEGKVEKYDKIQNSLRRNLKSLMQSSSEVVKMRIGDLRAGRIGAGVTGFAEIANSSSFGNEVAGAAKEVVNGIKELYKEFDIKPEEAITKELLEESRPYFTREMSEKSKNDRDIDLKSRQNRDVWGETKEITDEELEALKKIKAVTGTDKLPPHEKKEDMKLVKEMVTDIAQNPQGRSPIATVIAKGKEM